MTAYFAEVFAREGASVAGVTGGAMLASSRRGEVVEVMTPRFPDVLVLRQTGGVRGRADFLDQWRELVAQMVDRAPPSGATEETLRPSAQAPTVDVDAHKTAVPILAALHGSILGQPAHEPRPLKASLGLALVTLMATDDGSLVRAGTGSPIISMDS